MKKPATDKPDERPPKRPGGQRIHQAKIDKMAALRRRGVGYEDIATELGCSVRTVQRYVRNVEPQLHIPQANDQREGDPRALLRQILRETMDELFADNQLGGLELSRYDDPRDDETVLAGPPSIRFLNESESLIRRALDKCGEDTVRLIASRAEARRKFVNDTIACLRADYRRWYFITYHYYDGNGDGWVPPNERTAQEIAKLAKFHWLYLTIVQNVKERA
jgi:AcrR family transcriptional regulator